jgi:hypothetical protein
LWSPVCCLRALLAGKGSKRGAKGTGNPPFSIKIVGKMGRTQTTLQAVRWPPR